MASGSSAAGSAPFSFTLPTNVSSAVTLFGGFPKAGLEVFIQALAENQYLRILAEPQLVALSGQEASFLAGGEYPVPVVQGGLQGTTAISIEYKEYGVGLTFRPTVLGNGAIRLYVAPTVSSLTDVGAVTVQGFTIPALTIRKAETTLELYSGQTFGMAGRLQHAVNARNSRVPGLGDIPFLGALFRSVRYRSRDTELVVLVTASLVEPMSATLGPLTPGAAHTAPNDWELYALGKLEGSPASVATSEVWIRESGLSRLHGPGAWMTYDTPSTPVKPGVDPTATPAPAADSTSQDKKEPSVSR